MKAILFILSTLTIFNLAGQSNCSNTFSILCPEDITLSCDFGENFSPDTLSGLPFPSINTFNNVVYHSTDDSLLFLVTADFLCDTLTLSYEDETIALCSLGYKKIMTRVWTATVPTDTIPYLCLQTIYIQAGSLIDIDTFSAISYSCIDDIDSLDVLGHPHPISSGYPTIGGGDNVNLCENISFTYTDVVINLCGRSMKIIREWVIVDWCTDEIRRIDQLIKIEDDSPPDILEKIDSVYINMDPFSCSVSNYTFDIPEYIDCNDLDYAELWYEDILEDGSRIWVNNGSNLTLPEITFYNCEPFFNVRLRLHDVCDNYADCDIVVFPVDNVSPDLLCQDIVNLSLASPGIGRVHKEALIISTADNCAVDYTCIQKMSGQCFVDGECGEYVDFCCEEVGDTIMVRIEVVDKYGNSNFCMTRVKVEDKFPPQIVCSIDTLECTEYSLIDSLPKPLVLDNCDSTQLILVELIDERDQCGIGCVSRVWMAEDLQGNRSETCIEKIVFVNSDPFDSSDIIWPSDTTFIGDLDSLSLYSLGEPILNNSGCAMNGPSFVDIGPFVLDDADKILRVWTVLDWCQPNQSWRDTQEIKIIHPISDLPDGQCNNQVITIASDGTAMVEFNSIYHNNVEYWLIYEPSSFDCNDVGDNAVMVFLTEDQSTILDSCEIIITVTDTNELCQCLQERTEIVAPGQSYNYEAGMMITIEGQISQQHSLYLNAPNVIIEEEFTLSDSATFVVESDGCDN